MNNVKSTELCTVFVSSCDEYEDLWDPFFTILKNEWPMLCEYPIVLNTESKDFQYDGLNIQCFCMYDSGKRVRWGERLIQTLERINSKYIIFLLDDFFLTEKVNQGMIEKCVQYLEQDENAAVFNFVPTQDGNNEISNKYPEFEKRSQNGKWRMNAQAAIWRRDKLISFTRPHESVWEWEIYGSERSSRYKEDFYTAASNETRAFFYEDLWGGAVHRGKWTPSAVEICNKYGIDIDFDIRGYELDKPPYGQKELAEELFWLKRIFRPPFFKRLRKYIKMWLIDIPHERVIRYKSLK